MKEYHISEYTPAEIFEEILLAKDNGIPVKLNCIAEMTEDVACKTAAFGLPCIVEGWHWFHGVETTLENLLRFSPDELVLNVHVMRSTINKEVRDCIDGLTANPKFADVKVCLTEAGMNDPTNYATEQQWNELIVCCLDRNVKLSWDYDAAGYRYINYLKEISGDD